MCATPIAAFGELYHDGLSLALVAGVGLRTVAHVMHTYPTQAEAIKMAANAYARASLSPFRAWLRRTWVNR